MHTFDPVAINSVLDIIVGQLQAGFERVQAVAWPLLYAFAVIELVLVGLGIALGQRAAAGELIGKIIKIGLIVFLISNYGTLLQIILDGFTRIGGAAGGGDIAAVKEALTRPAALWKLGYDPALRVFDLAAKADAQQPGLALIFTVLGFGLLASFGLIAAQVVFAIVAFYCVALVGLLLVPLGIFRPTEGLLDRALSQILAAAARVLAIGLLVGALVGLWSKFKLTEFTIRTPIDEPVGLLLVAATFALLSVKLPSLAARAVGPIVSRRAVATGGTADSVARRTEVVTTSGQPAALRQGTELGMAVERGRRDDGAASAAAVPGSGFQAIAAGSPPAAVHALAGPSSVTARVDAPRHDILPAARDTAGTPFRTSGIAVETLAAAFHKVLMHDRERQREMARKLRRLQAMRAAAGRRPGGRPA